MDNKLTYAQIEVEETSKFPIWFSPYKMWYLSEDSEISQKDTDRFVTKEQTTTMTLYKTKEQALELLGVSESHKIVPIGVWCGTSMAHPAPIEIRALDRFQSQFFNDYQTIPTEELCYFWDCCNQSRSLKSTHDEVAVWFTDLMQTIKFLQTKPTQYEPEFKRAYLSYHDREYIKRHQNLEDNSQLNNARKLFFNQHPDIPVPYLLYFWEVAKRIAPTTVGYSDVGARFNNLMKHIKLASNCFDNY